MRDKILLRQLQALPLSAKVLMTQQRIREWYQYWNGKVVISFSGGKDSTVLAHLVHDLYPEVPMVFANTGLEYPEIQAFAREMGAEFVRPKMSFSEVISKYGYPIISKEVAEAIGWARRITPKNAETVETLERERDRESSSESNCKDYGRTKADGTGRTEEQRTATPPEQNYTDERDGGEQTLPATRLYPPPNEIYKQQATGSQRNKEMQLRRKDLQGQRTDYSPPLQKARTQKNREIQTATHGQRLTGEDGDESASPG